MRLNRYCSNCSLEKDANYENLCQACADITKSVMADPNNATIGVSALHRKVSEALSVVRQPLGIQSVPDSKTLFNRHDGSAL
jgi:hypothetical protein